MVSFHILQRILRTEFLRLKYRGLANHPLLASLPEHAKTHAAKRMFFAPSARFFFARIPKNVNRRAKLTPYRRPKLTPLCIVEIRA